jgi:hypothetical protein
MPLTENDVKEKLQLSVTEIRHLRGQLIFVLLLCYHNLQYLHNALQHVFTFFCHSESESSNSKI